jgi:hypothetical protein
LTLSQKEALVQRGEIEKLHATVKHPAQIIDALQRDSDA